MGTRADFYVGQGINAEWIGSIQYNGYKEAIRDSNSSFFLARTEKTFRRNVSALIAHPDYGGVLPANGWPWLWDTSHDTDYTYAWTPYGILCSRFGNIWTAPRQQPAPPITGYIAVFPDMAAKRKVQR